MGSKGSSNGKSRRRSLSRPRPSNVEKRHRNPYLNFVRDYRKDSSSSLSYKEILIRAGKIWRKLPAEEKRRYIEEATKISRDSPPKKSTKKKTKVSSDKKKTTQNSKKKAGPPVKKK